MKPQSKFTLIGAFVFVPGLVMVTTLLAVLAQDSQEILIESLESKTVDGKPVFNKIRWIQSKEKDIWMMNQSHYGLPVTSSQSDRLAIVIDKTKSPRLAKFYQLEPGPLTWEDPPQAVSFKVSCYICHSNGPRAIRPNYNSSVKVSFWDKLRLTYWNLRVKSYGKVLPHPDSESHTSEKSVPFKFNSEFETERLEIKACTLCHNDDGIFARGFLTRQHSSTIKFMFENKFMPPLGFPIDNQEKQRLQKFLNGF